MRKNKTLDILQLKNAIRLVIAGWLFGEGDIDEIVKILKEIANDYKEAIAKELEEHEN